MLILTSIILFSFILVWAANDVSLVSPADKATNWTNEVTFTCKVDNSNNIANLTLYHNQSGTWTNVSTNDTLVDGDAGDDTPFTVTINDGQEIVWNCLAYNSSTDEQNESWAAANYTISIDNSNPEGFNFTTPSNMSSTEATTNTTPLLDWNDTVDPNFLNYSLLLTDSNDFSNPNYTYELVEPITNSSFRIGTDTTANGSTSTALEDGNWYWKVTAYDGAEANGSTVQSTNMSSEYAIYIVDTTAPTVSISCSPASTSVGGTITCACSASDNLDSSPAVSYADTENPSTLSSGTFTTTCTATDNAGNSASASTSYAVYSSGGAGGSGGGSSGTTQTFSKVAADTLTTVKIQKKDIPISDITYTLNADKENVKFTVNRYNTLPTVVSSAPSNKEIYKYLQVTTSGISNSDFKTKPEINFEVEQLWVKDNNIDKNTIKLMRFVDDEWVTLDTMLTSEDDNNLKYRAITPGFSYFSIIGDKKKEEVSESISLEKVEEKLEEQPVNTKLLIGLIFLIFVILIVLYLNKKKIIKKPIFKRAKKFKL